MRLSRIDRAVRRSLVLGLKAKERLRALLNFGSIRVRRKGHATTERSDESWRVTFNIGARMLTERFALKYESGREAKLARMRVRAECAARRCV
jgi:predicted RNA binding protein YcfA (HicA-like mRNA interferase family)